MPAEPAESVVSEKPCPMAVKCRVSSGQMHRCRRHCRVAQINMECPEAVALSIEFRMVL
jgi:hypothetical protein